MKNLESPYIGEIVHYHPTADDSVSRLNGVTTCAAIIVQVHDKSNVNLKVFSDGEAFSRKVAVMKRVGSEDHSWSSITDEVVNELAKTELETAAPEETIEHEVSAEDVDANPGEGLKEGEKVKIPVESVEESAEEEAAPETEEASVPDPVKREPSGNGQDKAEPSDEVAEDQPSATEPEDQPSKDPEWVQKVSAEHEAKKEEKVSTTDTDSFEEVMSKKSADSEEKEPAEAKKEEPSDADVLDAATGNVPYAFKEEAAPEGDAPKEEDKPKEEEEALFPG